MNNSVKTVVISDKARAIFDNLNWNTVESDIKAGTVKVDITSRTLGVTSQEFRQELVNRFGSRVQFRRGRKGGVVLTDSPVGS